MDPSRAQSQVFPSGDTHSEWVEENILDSLEERYLSDTGLNGFVFAHNSQHLNGETPLRKGYKTLLMHEKVRPKNYGS
jgi:hypothetical protein